MHRIMIGFDAAIIRFLEKFARKMQVLTGKTNFFFANACLAIIIGFVLSRGIFLLDFSLSDPFVILGCIMMILFSSGEEKDRLKLILKGVANPRKISSISISIRFALIIIISLDLFQQYDRFAWIESFVLLYEYLMACDPLPPCHSKVMEWVRGLFSPKREEASVGAKS